MYVYTDKWYDSMLRDYLSKDDEKPEKERDEDRDDISEKDKKIEIIKDDNPF